MTPEEAQMLPLGLFKIYWKSGGHSLASVGQLYDGTRWLAPCNWTTGSQGEQFVATSDWEPVDKVIPISIPE